MYFLVTPHQGAGSAQLLSAVLKASYSDNRPFLHDLHQDSPAIQHITDSFRHYAANLKPYSFFETKAMPFLGIVVKKTSAITGYSNENTIDLDADHRGVCKFEAPTDSNFVTIRNTRVETLEDINHD